MAKSEEFQGFSFQSCREGKIGLLGSLLEVFMFCQNRAKLILRSNTFVVAELLNISSQDWKRNQFKIINQIRKYNHLPSPAGVNTRLPPHDLTPTTPKIPK